MLFVTKKQCVCCEALTGHLDGPQFDRSTNLQRSDRVLVEFLWGSRQDVRQRPLDQRVAADDSLAQSLQPATNLRGQLNE